MADGADAEVTQTDNQEQQGGNTQPDSSAGTENTDSTTAEHMIPQSRFNEVNQKYKEAQRKLAEIDKSRQEAENATLAEQNKWKELYEKAQTKLAEAEGKAKAAERSLWAQQVIAKTGLPAAMADRLKGDTFDDLLADAEELAKHLPKPGAPNTNSAAGDGGKPNGEKPWYVEQGMTKEEAAARLGVPADYLE